MSNVYMYCNISANVWYGRVRSALFSVVFRLVGCRHVKRNAGLAYVNKDLWKSSNEYSELGTNTVVR
jgi:hypothetical protein